MCSSDLLRSASDGDAKKADGLFVQQTPSAPAMASRRSVSLRSVTSSHTIGKALSVEGRAPSLVVVPAKCVASIKMQAMPGSAASGIGERSPTLTSGLTGDAHGSADVGP